MAFDRQNDYFYIDFKGGDKVDYRLSFYPGYHLDTTGFVANEFPDNVVLLEAEYKTGTIKDLPYGLPKANTLTIKLDLRGLNTGDWVDVGDWIIQGGSSATRSVLGRNIQIPNRWVLSEAGTGKFVGFQHIRTKKMKFKKNFLEYEVELIGAEKVCLENVLCQYVADNINIDFTRTQTGNDSDYIYDLSYDGGANGSVVLSNDDYASVTYKLSYISEFFSEISLAVNNLMGAFYRDSGITTQFDTSDLNDIWKFYRPDKTARNHPKTADQVTWDTKGVNGLVIWHSTEDSHPDLDNDGFMINDFLQYGNVWSFMRAFCDSFLLKTTIEYDNTELRFHFHKMFGAVSSNKTLEGEVEVEAELGTKYITKATSFVLGAGSVDTNQIDLLINEATLDEKSEENELMFNNYLLKYTDDPPGGDKEITDSVNRITYGRGGRYRTLYFEESKTGTNFIERVHEDCTIDMGDSVTISGDSASYEAIDYPASISSTPSISANARTIGMFYNLLVIYHSRLPYYGIGYVRNKALERLLGNKKHAILEIDVETDGTIVSLDDLYETFTVNLVTLSNFNSVQSLSTKAILVENNYDLISGKTKCKFFLRGDV